MKVNLLSGCYVVAVSGGVDSVVLLDLLAKQEGLQLIVAHFDHGVRDDSHLDAQLVEKLAAKYNLPFEVRREELGKKVSEDMARTRRYLFLNEVVNKYNAKLITAHHADDVIETIAINLSRGTGWRGLACLDSHIIRPMTDYYKSEIRQYASDNNLKWHEDSTNASDAYLRNRFRHQMGDMSGDIKRQLLALWSEQKNLKKQIDIEANKLVDINEHSRYFYIYADRLSVMECLRRATQARLTRPQIIRALHAIKTMAPNRSYFAGNGVVMRFTSRNFTVELIK